MYLFLDVNKNVCGVGTDTTTYLFFLNVNEKSLEKVEVKTDLKADELVHKKYINGNFIEREDDPYSKLNNKNEEIKNVITSMVMNRLPTGSELTEENTPSLLDIIKPENQGDKPQEGKLGDINNPIEVVGNVSFDGFLYTYGLYYSYGGKKYKFEREGAPDTTGSIKLYYTPDQLIGHYFVTV